MAERLCIDPIEVRDSKGRATCAKRFNKFRENDCIGCSRISFNRPLSYGKPREEAMGDMYVNDINGIGFGMRESKK